MIKSKQGNIAVKNPPRAVNERDDKLLTMLMEAMEKQNKEVSGDEPEEEDM